MIVQRIIQTHGGEVGIHSTEGQGVTVTLRLPRQDQSVRLLGPGENHPPKQLMEANPPSGE
jgi:hypothetical protein